LDLGLHQGAVKLTNNSFAAKIMPRPASHQSALGAKKKASSSSAITQNPPKRQKNWADGLLKFLDNPSDPAVVYLDDDCIAIRDAYPKAKVHWLVMPRDTKLHSLSDLKIVHLKLVQKMVAVANKLVRDNNNEKGDKTLTFRYGFHAVASMNHLHMHVISQDFDSPCIKNKKHWNSFTTTFFVPVEEVTIALANTGSIDFSYRANRLSDGLKCHRCGKVQTTIPSLKQHIKTCTFKAKSPYDYYSDYESP
jgi:aprataxin